jgi:hypothetical protein
MAAIVSQSIEGVDLLKAYAAADLSVTSTNLDVEPHPFAYGTRVVATDGSEWVFAKVGTVTGIEQYKTVAIDADCLDTIGIIRGTGVTLRGRRPGFYQGATTLTTGMAAWFMLSGKPTIYAADNCAPHVALYTTDVTGVLDDAIATGSQFPIRGVHLLTDVTATASAAGAVPAIATFPTIGPLTGDGAAGVN